MKEKTSIIVTHAFKYIKDADQIVILNKGKIVKISSPS
jgi:ABC-type multidrug transport system fused ATPase/permease subunit